MEKNQPVRFAKGIGRNQPCFCGSGKKFKHCHAPKGDFRMQVTQEETEAKAKSEQKPFVTLVLQPDGTFATTIQGQYPIVMLLGHLEMLKAQIIQQSMMQAAMAQAKEAQKKIVPANGPLPPRFPNMG